ncbi:MAG: tetratricopeptide repeat protein [Spirochaetales bacterium]|jgi:TolA-binding protein|nr:tetratricopeptide repeat protein [Spirochaetales bacterium]
MATGEHAAEQRNFTEALSFFIQRRRKALIVFFAVLIVCLLGLVIALQVRKNRIEVSSARIEAVQQQYTDWLAAKDEAEKENAAVDIVAKAGVLEEDLAAAAQAIIKEFPDLYAQMRAQDILASIAFRKKEYEKAAELWMVLAEKHPKTYYAPFALQNACAAWEEAGRPDKAAEALTQVVTKFSAAFPDMPRVLFSLGRLAEAGETFEDAQTHYNRLVEEYPGSSWTKLAYNRIIFLEAQNKIQK